MIPFLGALLSLDSIGVDLVLADLANQLAKALDLAAKRDNFGVNSFHLVYFV